MALRRAARAVQAGDADVVACIAGDTNHVDSFRLTLANFSQFARDAVYPYGAGGPNASFAFLTAYYMHKHGATREDFGKLCVAQRATRSSSTRALFKKPLSWRSTWRRGRSPSRCTSSIASCLAPAPRLFWSCPRIAPSRWACLMRGCCGTIERHNAFATDPVQMRAGWALDRDDLYRQAGAGPEDMDFVADV